MNKLVITLSCLALLLAACGKSDAEFSADTALEKSVKEYMPLIKMDKPEGKPSARCTKDGVVQFVVPEDWTSGFYPGCLWYLYEYSKDDYIKSQADATTHALEKAIHYRGNHDVGFRVYCSFGNAYRLTGDEYYKDGIITAANTLMTRYSEKMGLIRSWDFNQHKWQYPVIIDNMMNLELLFEATKMTGDNKYKDAAISHADKTLVNHFRSDNSSYHVVDYDTITGDARLKQTHQGLSDESAWARGQAWGMYGYTMCYRYTQDKKYLDEALKIKDFYLKHANLPEDLIAYWDFDVKSEPNTPRDVSASALVASALLELAEYVPEQKEAFVSTATTMLKNITEKYMNSNTDEHPDLLLKSSTGSFPSNSEVNIPIIYADYYYLEALLRLRRITLQ